MNILDIYRKIGGIINPDDLNDLVCDLHEARRRVVKYKEDKIRIEKEIALSKLGEELDLTEALLTSAELYSGEIDTKLRQVALDVYSQTEDTKPFGDRRVQIKMYATVDYDPDEALTYAREHIPAAVSLKRAAFNKAAKVLNLPFVTISTEPRATVARDLSQFLTEGED